MTDNGHMTTALPPYKSGKKFYKPCPFHIHLVTSQLLRLAAPLGHGENKIKMWKQSMLKQSDCVSKTMIYKHKLYRVEIRE